MTDWLYSEDERDCIIANLAFQRRRWLDAYHESVRKGDQHSADYYLDYVRDFDTMIYKTERLVEGISADREA